MHGGPVGMRLPEHQHVETQLEVHFGRPSGEKSLPLSAMPYLPKDMELIPARRPHVGGWDDDSEVILVLIPPLVFERAADELLVRPKFVILSHKCDAEPFISQIMSSLRSQFHSPFGVSKLYVESAGYLLAEHILRNYAETAPVTRITDRFGASDLRRITAFVDEHLESGVTVAETSRVSKMGIHRFARLLRLATGCTPYEFVQARRVELAKTLLRQSNVSLAEIAYRLGFASQSHFTSVFHRATRISPHVYRMNVRSHALYFDFRKPAKP